MIERLRPDALQISTGDIFFCDALSILSPFEPPSPRAEALFSHEEPSLSGNPNWPYVSKVTRPVSGDTQKKLDDLAALANEILSALDRLHDRGSCQI